MELSVPSGTSDVTIIIATHDRPDWLSVAVRSIQVSADVARPHGVFTRVIVVDNGDNPRTRAVCADLGVTHLHHSVRVGRKDASASRMLGVSESSSEYCGFFDDDDVMLPRYIWLHINALRAGYDVAYSTYYVVDAELKQVRRHRQLPMQYGDLLFNHNMVNDHCLWRRDTVKESFDETLEFMMPFAAWLDLAHRGCRFVHIGEATYLYRRHSKNARNVASTDAQTSGARTELVDRYRRLVIERDGRLPPVSLRLRAHRVVPSLVRRLVGRIGTSL